jgi:transcriptional regulator with XRE-family HTH domain
MDVSFSDQLREAIRNSGMTVYFIAKASGVDKAVLSRFLNGKAAMSMASIDQLCPVLGLRLLLVKQVSSRREPEK